MQPSHQPLTKFAVWYSGVVAYINELGWLMIVTLPTGLFLLLLASSRRVPSFAAKSALQILRQSLKQIIQTVCMIPNEALNINPDA